MSADEDGGGRPVRVSAEVLWYGEAKGWGVVRDEHGREVTVDYAAIVGEGLRSLRAGQRVELEISPGPGGPVVERAIVLAKPAPSDASEPQAEVIR